MRKSVKKFAIVFLALVMVLAVFAGCGGDFSSKPLDGYSSSGEVTSNGGFVVQKGEWIYFINGSEEYTADNTFNKVQKGSLMRIKESDLAAGNYDKTDVVVPLLMVSQDYTSGLYIYGDYVYYATPTSTKNKDGKVENSYLDFKRSKLDGSSTMRDYYFRISDNTTVYRYVEVEGTVYCLYVDSGEKEIHSYNTATNENTVLAAGYESYVFDASDVTNPNVYYTMPVEKKVGYKKGSTNQEKYKQVYTANAATTKSPYEIDLAADYTDKDSGDVMEYVNLGTLVFDGIGKLDTPTVFNVDGNDGASDKGYTYSLIKYENGGLYYTRTDATASGSSVGDGGALYYIADGDVKAADWNAVKGNDSDKNVQLAANTTTAGASSMFYIEEGAHYYMYVKDNAIVRVKVGDSSNAFAEETVYVAYNATGATLLYRDGNYVYYSTSGTNGNALNRVIYNGDPEDYNAMLAGEDVIKPAKYLDVDYNSSWYKPEIVSGFVFFANASTYGYNYVYVFKNPETNAALEEINDKLEKVNDVFEDIAVKFSDISNAAKYYYYTGDNATIYTEDYKDEYKEDALVIYEQFVKCEKGVYATDELKDGDKAFNVETYFYNRIGVMKEDDVDARDEALKSALLVKEADEDESTGWKTWQYVALWVPVGVVVLAAAIVVPIVIVRKKRR